MEKRITDDGSETYYNSDFDQLYHSSTGAVEEALQKYAQPLQIAECARDKERIVLLDFCFGLGYNTAAAIDAIRSVNPSCYIEVVALENDQLILDATHNVNPGFESYHLIQKCAKSHSVEQDTITISLLFGDAQEKILEVEQFDFDFVFFDPFSPAKCPALWTQDIFTECFIRMKDGAKLATYSCARKVRDAMRESGFLVTDGPSVGRRGPSTIAIKQQN